MDGWKLEVVVLFVMGALIFLGLYFIFSLPIDQPLKQEAPHCDTMK